MLSDAGRCLLVFTCVASFVALDTDLLFAFVIAAGSRLLWKCLRSSTSQEAELGRVAGRRAGGPLLGKADHRPGEAQQQHSTWAGRVMSHVASAGLLSTSGPHITFSFRAECILTLCKCVCSIFSYLGVWLCN